MLLNGKRLWYDGLAIAGVKAVRPAPFQLVAGAGFFRWRSHACKTGHTHTRLHACGVHERAPSKASAARRCISSAWPVAELWQRIESGAAAGRRPERNRQRR